MALNVQQEIQDDTEVVSQQPFPFNPLTEIQCKNAGTIQINVENQAEYFLASQSWLQKDGRLLQVDGDDYTAADNIALVDKTPLNWVRPQPWWASSSK